MTALAEALPAGRAPRRRRADRRRRGEAVGLATPALLFLLALFLLPLARLLWLSLDEGLAPYARALTGELYLTVFLETFRIAAIVTLVSLVLGYPLAWWLATTARTWRLLGLALLMLPFWTSILVRTYGWMVILGRNGIVNRMLIGTGIIDAPLPLLNNVSGVVIGMAHVLLPYMIFPLYAVMKRIDPGLVLAAEGMGASGWQVFRRIYFPLTLPGVLAGTTLVYVLSIGFFITPALLGGGKVAMIAVLIEQQVHTFLNWGFAAALSVVLLTATLAVYALLRFVLRGDMRWT